KAGFAHLTPELALDAFVRTPFFRALRRSGPREEALGGIAEHAQVIIDHDGMGRQDLCQHMHLSPLSSASLAYAVRCSIPDRPGRPWRSRPLAIHRYASGRAAGTLPVIV